MASLRDIKRRIEGVKNTRQITRAMKLVAGAEAPKGHRTGHVRSSLPGIAHPCSSAGGDHGRRGC